MPVRERELLGFVNVPGFRDHDLCPVATDRIFPGSGFDFGVDFRGLAHAVPPCIYSISLSPTLISSAVRCPMSLRGKTVSGSKWGQHTLRRSDPLTDGLMSCNVPAMNEVDGGRGEK